MQIQNRIISNRRQWYDVRKKLRNNMSEPEVLLWSRLKGSQIGYKFRRQHSMFNHILDFYCPELKLNIEIDGMHHAFQVEKDAERDNRLFCHGIYVVRILARDVYEDVDNVVSVILQEIKKIKLT